MPLRCTRMIQMPWGRMDRFGSILLKKVSTDAANADSVW